MPTSKVCVLVEAGRTVRTYGGELEAMVCVASPPYVAVSAKLKSVGLVILVGVKVTWQLADPDCGAPSPHVVALNELVPPAMLGTALQLTVPVGAEPPLVSDTVTVQVALSPTKTSLGCP